MKCFVMFALVMYSLTSGAQTWEEWFEQKETQKKYLRQQIAALTVFLDYAKKGYQLAADGLAFIDAVKNGDYLLHYNFFESLRNVNPAISKSARARDIIALSEKIIKDIRTDFLRVEKPGWLSGAEQSHCRKVFERILYACLDDVEIVALLLRDNEYEMTDAERIGRLQVIHRNMEQLLAFETLFREDLKILCRQREQENKEIANSKILNVIK